MAKGKKPSKPGSEPAAASSRSVAEAAVKRGKSKAQSRFPYLTSVSVLVAAVGLTYVFTRSPPPPPHAAATTPATSSRMRERTAATTSDFEPQSRADTCASWKQDGECESNAAFMTKNCPGTCPNAKKPKKQPKATDPPKPKDANPNCPTWAAAGECDANPTYMKQECAIACANGGADAETGVAEPQDIHQDCAAWVQYGECYRNPAFMLQQCKASCSKFAADNDAILQDTSDTCVNFALRGGCTTDLKKADTVCRASCHIQKICANHTETVTCSKALRCEAIGDHKTDCARRAAQGKCATDPVRTLKECLKSCSEVDLEGMMRFHMPHTRTTLSPLIDLPHAPPRLAGFYATPPQARNNDHNALALCDPAGSSFAGRVRTYRQRRRERSRWSVHHWSRWSFVPGREVTPRVPHLFEKWPAEEGSERLVTVQHISFSPRIRYVHQLLTPAECEHVLKVSQPLFSRSPVRGSVTRVRTSTTAMLGGSRDDAVVTAIRQRISRFSGYPVDLIEPLQVVRYEQGQKYEGHHDFFDVCDVDDKVSNGRRQVTFLIYLVGMPEGEDGGGTRFPELSLEVRPEQGSAVVFNDCFDNGEEDGRSLHAGQPPLDPKTIKYAINGWIRSRSVYKQMSFF